MRVWGPSWRGCGWWRRTRKKKCCWPSGLHDKRYLWRSAAEQLGLLGGKLIFGESPLITQCGKPCELSGHVLLPCECTGEVR